MSVEIRSENVDINGSGVLLVSVKGGSSLVGTCTAGHCARAGGDASSISRLFYMGNDPVINIVCPNNAGKKSDKLVSFCPGFHGVDNDFRITIGDCFAKINHGDSLEIGLRDIFALLSDGIYTVYTSEYYPTDGSGTLFWGAYNISHEVRGTAEHNKTVGINGTYRPCFLMPSQPLDYYSPKIKAVTDESCRSRQYQGIVYHLSGLHSVLLKGHHGMICCVERNIPIKCAVIEKISDYYTDPPVNVKVPAEAAENAEGEAVQEAVSEIKSAGISGFRSASVKIPIDRFPKYMLRQILESRFETKPQQYPVLLKHLNTVRRKAISNQVVGKTILEACDNLPDVEMVESAFAIDSLSDEQLNCLLAGETEMNGEVIISPNFYSSVVTACNYLQFHSEARFIEFALAILDNPELYATHEYIARRISRLSSNKKVYNYFKGVIADGGARYEKILHLAQRFVEDYDLHNG